MRVTRNFQGIASVATNGKMLFDTNALIDTIAQMLYDTNALIDTMRTFDQTQGFGSPGAFKLDHLQPVKPIFSPNFATFSLSYWRPILITPEG